MNTCSMFSQLLPLIPRRPFDNLVRSQGANKGLKGFSNWDQLVSLLFCQLGRAHSLREIHGGLASCAGRLSHLGLKQAPKVSTLSYANRNRDPELFEALFHHMYQLFANELVGPRKFRFKNKLISLDATVINLCLGLFDWADYTRTKGAVKLHLQLDHDGHLPKFAVISTGNVHEIKVARTMRFERGTILAFDRGYTDYDWFDHLSDEGVFFVTRVKSNARYQVVEEHPCPNSKSAVSDHDVVSDHRIALADCRHKYRLVKALVPDATGSGEIEMEFLTNHRTLCADTIAAIYRERWQIELFFKAIKQNFKIKTFLGTNRNAVCSQIWTALIAMLLVKYLKHKSRYHWSLSQLMALLRLNLFVHHNLREWLDDPERQPPEQEASQQLVLNLA